ncbi:UNVERIFIED_CONTAM: macrolide transport system ATP-binding/permease protein [Acetivibrio alkalicellulosi]
MLLLECSKIKKYYGDRLVINLENLKVYSEDRIGIVGVNGVGKTTLVNILSQKIEPEEGWVRLYGEYSIISQFEPSENNRLRPELASKFSVKDTWDENMSGGEQTRFKLAACFGNDSKLIFADEPTSSVDMKGIELMESWFGEHRGGVILISHDRSFLDKLCNKILEIEKGNVKLYNGNYSQYSTQKAREIDRAQFEYLQYVNEKKRLEGITVDLKQKSKSIKKAPKRMGNSEARLHKMGNQKAKASLDQTRKNIASRIEHLDVKEKPSIKEQIKFDISKTKKVYSTIIIEGNKINKAFGDKVIFKDADFKVENGSKVALVGSNGSGKTTLLKMIMQKDDAIKIAPAAKIGYFSQDMSILNENITILENVMENSIYQESFARTLLARLLFKGEDAYKKVNVLSGGERVKVSFAKILMEDINLLILDEPTNYLDIKSIEVIEEALANYDRTLLFVSHDRSFISAVANHIMTIENSKIKIFNSNYVEYLAKKNQTEDQVRENERKQILILQNRLSQIISRLSIPAKGDDPKLLNKEYHQVLGELNKIKAKGVHV